MDFLEHEIEEILNIFREESEEQLEKLNKNLLKLEENPKDYTAISELFREAHSLKGAARMIGLNDIQSIAHKLEDVFGQIKEDYLNVTAEIIDVMCRAVDCISSIINESIRTRGNAEVPEIQDIVTALGNITNSEIPAKEQTEVTHENVSEIVEFAKKSIENQGLFNKKNEDIKNLLNHVSVNVEKLKVFATSSDAIEEFLFFIIKLDKAFESFENKRVTGLIEDIKIKLETALRGSGILVDDEISEIEETLDNFIKAYERISYKPSPPPEKVVNEDFIFKHEIARQETEQKEEIIDVKLTETVEDLGEITTIYEENSKVNFIKNNINAFLNHTEENIPKIEEVILKLNSLTATINEDKIRQIIEKIVDLLVFSKDQQFPLNQDMIKVLEESLYSTINMLTPSNEDIEDPFLILQRITVLHQMLKLASSKEDLSPEIKESSGERTNLSPVVKNAEIFSKNKQPEEPKTVDLKFGESNTIKTLRVDTQKLDHLVNQTGELIIAKIKAKEHLTDIEKMIRYIEEWHREWIKTKQYFKYTGKYNKTSDLEVPCMQFSSNKSINAFFEGNSSKLLNLMNKMNSFYKIVQEDDARMNLIVSGLEEKIKSVRVLPLATIFHLFPRMVRDIARDKGKEVEFLITGSETSVDKKIIEEIKSPLMHIIRNSIDHGIELSAERTEKGKPASGKILLAAYHLENSVLIEITDDGKGVDVDMIKRKVLQKELLTPEELEAMSEEQIMNIIFWPGFSTGETVTDISGRGIGLDIVYTKISQLNGNIKVKSNLGDGCKVSLQIPVTMATINAFLVEVNQQTFAIPTSSIKTTLLVNREQIFYKEGRKAILVEDKTVPICLLTEVLEQPQNPNKDGKLVVIVAQVEDVQVGFIVDKLIGDHEILHKNLSAPLLKVRNVAGITTLGSGNLCLILNINDLIKSAYMGFRNTGGIPAITANPFIKQEQKKILVVDDSATTRILQRNILKSAGYKVGVAINGFDALTKIVSNDYDFIVTDAEMPEMNGFELTERLRHDEKYKNIPIIIVTSLSSEEDRIRGMEAGANAYITKGKFNQDELLSIIKRLVA